VIGVLLFHLVDQPVDSSSRREGLLENPLVCIQLQALYLVLAFGPQAAHLCCLFKLLQGLAETGEIQDLPSGLVI
jgi:hypothetical protein